MAAPPRTRPPAPPPDWELVYKRNPVERIKRDKSPLGILDELPALIAAGYEQVPEEDLVRLKDDAVFQRTLFNRELTPLAFALYDAEPALARLGEIMHGYERN